VFGFCYYHYWFNGKKLLERPAEEILKSGSPRLPFCFSWANQTWSRTWYSSKREVLLKQEYGGEQEWKEHFEYLLPFFLDERYIKIDNEPVLVIYKPSLIRQLDEMIDYWNQLARKAGFSGMHVIETLTASQSKPVAKRSEAALFYEPGYTIKFGGWWCGRLIQTKLNLNNFLAGLNLPKPIKFKFLLNRLDYDGFYRRILKRDYKCIGKKVYPGAFVDFDDTARRGRAAYVFDGVTPEKFERNLKSVLLKAKENNSDFVFLTAWNEWAEGAVLEPDYNTGYGYLEAVRNAVKKIC
jgi:hypothetical protein